MVARVDGHGQTEHGYKASLRLIDTVTNKLIDGIVINECLIVNDQAVRDCPVYINDKKIFDTGEKFEPEPMPPYVPLRKPKNLSAVEAFFKGFKN